MKRQMTSDEVINEIAEVLRQGDGEFIAGIANQVLVPEVTYLEDSIFEHTVEELEDTARIFDPVDDDKFQCEICKQIRDIDDSMKPLGKKGGMICVSCSNAKEIKELKEEVAHLESLLPHITDRNELSGTHEVLGRLEEKIKALEGENNFIESTR